MPDSQRILFIGDSFTEGIGVEFEDTFVGIIGKKLSYDSIEILNAGVSSYSPAIYYRKTKYLLEETNISFDSLVVFLDISDIEDEAEFYWIDDDRVIGTDRVPQVWLGMRKSGRTIKQEIALHASNSIGNAAVYNSIIVCLGYLVKSNITIIPDSGEERSEQDDELGTGKLRALWTVNDALFTSFGAKGLRRGRENMDRLLDVLKRYDIDLTVVVYPWPDQIIEQDLHSRQVSFWRAWAEERGVQFIDLFPVFVSEKDGEATIRENFLPGDVHWNEAGHRLVAERFLKAYERKARQGD
jgi:lysophospholipase L1-like esterase